MWDKNREISPLQREEGYEGKDLEKKVSFKTRMKDPVRHANHRFRSRVGAWQWRWPTDKEHGEMEMVP